MTRHLTIQWPDPAPFRDRDGAPIRLLCVSDSLDPAIVEPRNRAALGVIDLIVGCGDLDCDDLAFIADSVDAPLVYVYGNHDTEDRWKSCGHLCPDAIVSTAVMRRAGLAIAGLTWPGSRGKLAQRSERLAWSQVLTLATRRIGRPQPMIVMSHVPPLGAGDVATDPYHRGFKGYRWFLERERPLLWLHGHTPMAAIGDWQVQVGRTMVVNVTGSVVVELTAPPPHSTAGRWRGRGRGTGREREAQRVATPDGGPPGAV